MSICVCVTPPGQRKWLKSVRGGREGSVTVASVCAMYRTNCSEPWVGLDHNETYCSTYVGMQPKVGLLVSQTSRYKCNKRPPCFSTVAPTALCYNWHPRIWWVNSSAHWWSWHTAQTYTNAWGWFALHSPAINQCIQHSWLVSRSLHLHVKNAKQATFFHWSLLQYIYRQVFVNV
jgi:hypothetical protein